VAAQTGIAVAEAQLNSYGGILGKQIHFRLQDDASDPMVGTGVVNGFIGDAGHPAMPGLLGPSGSTLAHDLQALVHDAKVSLISSSASTPVTRDAEACPDRYFFRTAASHALQAKALAFRAYSGFASPGDAGSMGPAATGCRQLAVINTDDDYGNPMADGIASEIALLGGAVVFQAKVPTRAQATDYYNGVVQNLIMNSPMPDCQIVVSLSDVADAYMRSFKTMTAGNPSWTSLVSMCSNGCAPQAFLVNGRDNPQDPSSPTVGEGMYVMNLDLNPTTPQHQEFVNLYSLYYPLDGGTDPPGYAANNYDAAILLALAIEAAGTATDPVAIRDQLIPVSRPPGTAYPPGEVASALEAIQRKWDIDYDGASGPVDFDDCGEVISGYVVSQIVGGQFAPLPSESVSVKDLQKLP
jgi:ABC-type branched-subunit amino acid transport system substrate-binding protein